MHKPLKVTVARDLIRIHLVITRAIAVSLEQISVWIEKDHIEENLAGGFTNYLFSLLNLFHAHHIVEDEQIFPYFRQHKLEAPYEVLNAQHLDLLPVLDSFEKIINHWQSDINNLKLLNNLKIQLEKLQKLWLTHFQLEEEFFTEATISKLISDEEQIKLAHQFSEYAAKHIEKDYLVIPFILYNLPPDERALMAEVFPRIVTEDLVPNQWKQQWQSMLPFLLINE